MTLRIPILAAALFTSVAALGLSSTGHAASAPANPGAMPTDASHHSAGDGNVPFCPPTKNGHIIGLRRHVPSAEPVPSPWNMNYFENYSEQFGFGDRYKSHAHDKM